MNSCSYCGRQNPEEAIFCRECGTQIVEKEKPKPAQPRNLTGLKNFLKYGALLFALILFYLLSLGPVTRFCAKRTVIRMPGTMMITTNSTAVATMTVTTTLPPWLGRAYMPAFQMSSVPGVGEIYFRYLELWAPPETPPKP